MVRYFLRKERANVRTFEQTHGRTYVIRVSIVIVDLPLAPNYDSWPLLRLRPIDIMYGIQLLVRKTVYRVVVKRSRGFSIAEIINAGTKMTWLFAS